MRVRFFLNILGAGAGAVFFYSLGAGEVAGAVFFNLFLWVRGAGAVFFKILECGCETAPAPALRSMLYPQRIVKLFHYFCLAS